MADYDAYADIYDVWVDTAPITAINRPFYIDEYLAASGTVVELGVGNGRILVEAARRGAQMVGIDSSAKMLDLCRARVEDAGVTERVTLMQADFRDFVLDKPAALVAIPFHSIGHMVTLADKKACFDHVLGQLAPGGRLVFDHFLFDRDLAARRNGMPVHRAEFIDEQGRQVMLFICSVQNYDAQTMRVISWTDTLDDNGVAVERRYRPMDFSWATPEQFRSLLETAGFEIETCYGDYARTPFGDGALEQVWVARRPSR